MTCSGSLIGRFDVTVLYAESLTPTGLICGLWSTGPNSLNSGENSGPGGTNAVIDGCR